MLSVCAGNGSLVYAISPCLRSAVKSQNPPSARHESPCETRRDVDSQCVSRMLPIRRINASVSSGVVGTPDTKQNPNSCCRTGQMSVVMNTKGSTYDFGEPPQHASLCLRLCDGRRRHETRILDDRRGLCDARVPEDLAVTRVSTEQTFLREERTLQTS